MTVSRLNWDEYITPGARKAYTDHYKSLDKQYADIFNVETSDRAYENFLVSVGLGTVPKKPELERIKMDSPQPVGSLKVVHDTYALGVEFSWEVIEDELYGVLTPKAGRQLARSHVDAEERAAAAIFNNAFSSTTGYDGEVLIGATHPGVGGTSVDNSASVDFSHTALQTAIEHYMLLEDERGLKIDVMPDTLAHHPANYWAVREVLRSGIVPFTGSANETNRPNVVASDFPITPVSWRYLSDPDAWFLFKRGAEFGPVFFWRRSPRDATITDEFDEATTYKISSRFSSAFGDWKLIYGSAGA